MKLKKISLYKYVKTPAAWRYCRVALSKNNKPKHNYVIVKGVEEYHAEGSYYLLVDGQWIPAGETAAEADKERGKQQTRLKAIEHGWIAAPVKPETKPNDATLGPAITAFMAHYSIGKDVKTVRQMQTTLDEFAACCEKTDLSLITKVDLAEYWQYCVDESPTNSRRTAHNEVMRVHSFLIDNGIYLIAKKRDRDKNKWKIPPYMEAEPEVYEDEDLTQFFNECALLQLAIYKTFLMSGMREKELVYLEWSDIDMKRSVLHVREKKGVYDFQPKKYRERDITIPDDLLNMLKALPRTSSFVFPTESGKPNMKLWRTAKRIAVRAGCDPAKYWLHKFRATWATRLLQKGVPLQEVMRLGGWRDLKSVQRYMGRMQQDQVRERLNGVWAAE